MNTKKLILATAITGLLTGLSACNSSDSDSGVSVNRVVTGPITSFGSVYVNGTRYNTNNSTIYLEDDPGSESDLRVGMMVSIETSASNSATAVYYDDDLEGFVNSTAIAADNTGTMVIMGQDVSITSNTIIESKVAGIASVSDIVAGNIVEVSGYSNGEGNISATRLEVKAGDLATYLLTNPQGVELKGIVAGHDSNDQSFNIGSLSINYSNAMLDDMPQGSWNDLYVEVKSIQELVTGQLIASKVELENDGKKYIGDEDDEIEVYGTISEVSEASITVNGITFLLTDNTEYEYGSASDLSIDTMIEVEGYINTDGDLVALEVEFEDEGVLDELKGTVSAIETSDTNIGTITLVTGEIIFINNDTIMYDSRDDNGVLPDTNFNLSDLGTGDYVEVYVVDNNDGTFTATKLEREDAI